MGESMKTTWIGDVQSGQHDNKEVELKGWVKRSRGSNKIRFIVLRDSTGTIQCVAKRDVLGDESFEQIKSALIESSIILKGTVNVDERSEGGHELVVNSAEVIGPVNPETPFPITESAMAAADGGETEFIHYGLKIRPEKGKTLIWPAEWTHAHRGCPVIKGPKHVITGWMYFATES